MLCVTLLSVLLSHSFYGSASAVASAAQQSAGAGQMTTHSPLTAFKQLGFDTNGYRAGNQHVSGGHPQSPSYIPYAISDFSDPPPSIGQNKKLLQAKSKVKNSDSGNSAEGFQQIHHPNDILSNMGVDLPSEEILGKNEFKFIDLSFVPLLLLPRLELAVTFIIYLKNDQ